MKKDRDDVMATWRIALKMRVATPRVRRELMRMERDGIVCRVHAWSSVNNIVWKLKPANTNSPTPQSD
jgi:hypothetical protein